MRAPMIWLREKRTKTYLYIVVLSEPGAVATGLAPGTRNQIRFEGKDLMLISGSLANAIQFPPRLKGRKRHWL